MRNLLSNKPLHYGWIVVAGSMIVLAISSLTGFSFGIFLKPVTSEFGWERGSFSLAISITLLGGGLLSILTGRLSDKYGPRFLVTAGGLLVGTGFLLMSRITALWQVYLIFGFLIAVGTSTMVVPITSTIPRWFAAKRGIAMGLTFSGVSIGTIIGPILTQSLISSQGWRGGLRGARHDQSVADTAGGPGTAPQPGAGRGEALWGGAVPAERTRQ